MKVRHYILGAAVLAILSLLVSAIDMRPQSDINMTDHSIKDIFCVRFNDSSVICAGVNGSIITANITNLQANITWLRANTTSQQGMIDLLNATVTNQGEDIDVLETNMTDAQRVLAAGRVMEFCPAGEYMNGSNLTDIRCGTPAGGGGNSLWENTSSLYITPLSSMGLNITNSTNATAIKLLIKGEDARIVFYLQKDGAKYNRLTFYGLGAASLVYEYVAAAGQYASFKVTPNNTEAQGTEFGASGSRTAEGCGLYLSSATNECRVMFPYTNRLYDLGRSTRCFNNTYAYQFNDCGSQSERLKDKKALPLILRYADAELATTTKDYEEKIPDEFKGDIGDCGHRVTILDEVITALVLGESELNAKIENTSNAVLEKRVTDLENELVLLEELLVLAGIGVGVLKFKTVLKGG
jgi:hypothetical protein